MTVGLLALALAFAPLQEPAADPALARGLLDDLRAWIRAPELPVAEDIQALREEAERFGATDELVRELGNLGHRLDQDGRGDEGRALVAWSGGRALENGDLGTRSWSLDWLAQNAWVRGELEEAAGYFAGAAENDGRRHALGDQARHMADIARIRLTQGRLEDAEAEIARAEDTARSSNSDAAVRSVAEIRGSLLFELGRHREALALCLEHGDATVHDEIQVRLDILAADVLADVGRLESALTFARRAHEIALSAEVLRAAPLLHSEPRLTLALLLGDLGHCDEAISLLDAGAAEFARLGDARGVAWTDKNRGFVLFAAGRWRESLPAFERAWRAGEELGVPFLAGMGALGVAEALVASENGAPAEAERVQTALAAAERVGQELHERTLEWRVAAVRGALGLARGEYESALPQLRRAVARVERWRRRLGASGLVEHALRQRSDPYRDAAFAAAHAGRAEEALRYASLLQARVLDELSARRDGPLPQANEPGHAALRERIGRLEARVKGAGTTHEPARAQLEEQLERAESELDLALLSAELASGRTLSAPAESVPIQRIGVALAEQGFGAALAYLVGAEETLVLRVGAGPDALLEARILPVGRAWLEARIERLRRPLERLEAGELDLAHLDFDHGAARELFDALVRPLALASGMRLALVADGMLASIPFELFVSGGEPGTFDLEQPFAHLAGLRFLADEHELVCYGSLARLLRPVAVHAGGAVVFLPPPALGVRYAEDEARAIERALGGTHVVRGARAEDVAARASGAALVHFAAHGRIDAARPAHGHLVLGGADGAGARLESWQAAELALDGATVVLSACHTGRGEWRAGAGLAGLTRGFLEAGAREVVASHWAVDDRVTTRFMELFYGARARGLATPEALQAARKLLRTEADPRGFALAHPAFWAAWFVQR